MYTNTDMTLYNRYYDATARLYKWKRTQIQNVFWVNSKGANVIKSGMDDCDSVKVFILLSTGGFVEPKEFDGTAGWTLQPGDKICLGLLNDDYDNITDLEKEHDNVHDITSVDLKDYGSQSMRHWEIGGK